MKKILVFLIFIIAAIILGTLLYQNGQFSFVQNQSNPVSPIETVLEKKEDQKSFSSSSPTKKTTANEAA